MSAAFRRICLRCGGITTAPVCRRHEEVEPTKVLVHGSIPANEATR